MVLVVSWRPCCFFVGESDPTRCCEQNEGKRDQVGATSGRTEGLARK